MAGKREIEVARFFDSILRNFLAAKQRKRQLAGQEETQRIQQEASGLQAQAAQGELDAQGRAVKTERDAELQARIGRRITARTVAAETRRGIPAGGLAPAVERATAGAIGQVPPLVTEAATAERAQIAGREARTLSPEIAKRAGVPQLAGKVLTEADIAALGPVLQAQFRGTKEGDTQLTKIGEAVNGLKRAGFLDDSIHSRQVQRMAGELMVIDPDSFENDPGGAVDQAMVTEAVVDPALRIPQISEASQFLEQKGQRLLTRKDPKTGELLLATPFIPSAEANAVLETSQFNDNSLVDFEEVAEAATQLGIATGPNRTEFFERLTAMVFNNAKLSAGIADEEAPGAIPSSEETAVFSPVGPGAPGAPPAFQQAPERVEADLGGEAPDFKGLVARIQSSQVPQAPQVANVPPQIPPGIGPTGAGAAIPPVELFSAQEINSAVMMLTGKEGNLDTRREYTIEDAVEILVARGIVNQREQFAFAAKLRAELQGGGQ